MINYASLSITVYYSKSIQPKYNLRYIFCDMKSINISLKFSEYYAV